MNVPVEDADSPYENPIHDESGPATLWTRVNSEEATPGVVHPLHWDFFRLHAERAMRAATYDRGIYTEAEIAPPESADGRWTATFYGRVALNVDALRAIYDRVPGTSADEFEQTMFGTLRPDAPSNPTSDRHALIRERSVELARTIPGVVEGLHAEFDGWWRASVSGGSLDNSLDARAVWIDARDRLERSMRPHTIASNFATEGYASLARACATVGRFDLLTTLTSGYGDTEDDRVSAALWEVAHGRSTVDALLASYGYQGDQAGNLAVRVWREDPGLITAMLEAMAGLDEGESPVEASRRHVADRLEAEAELLSLVDVGERDDVRRAMEQTHRFTALRQLGKVTFWRAVDVGRAASRAVGRELADAGALDDPEDVFFLVGAELVPSLAPDARDRVAHRKAQRAVYEAVDLPLTWVGEPVATPQDAASAVATGTTLQGLGVYPGRVEARARVVLVPGVDEPIEPGEVLVCHTTDPSWAGYFMVAGALVIDVGGPLSHGAIVARELGVPCVINTRTGTTDLVTGDLVRVDGDAGTIDVLERAER